MENYISPLIVILCIYSVLYSSCAQRFAANFRDVTGVSSLQELCPYNQYCTSNATSKLNDKTRTSCCESCSCADDCWKRGKCCEDKQITTAKKPLETCEAVAIKSVQKGNWGYYVINSCPTENQHLEKKCSGELKTSLGDLVWVTDRRTNKIYGNKHCALCNGVEDYNPWQLATDCMEALNGQNSPDKIMKELMETCSLTVKPPSMEDHTDKTCLIPDIKTCNVTGQWKVYDQALETACNTVQQTYRQTMVLSTIIYKNIHCFLCNSQDQLISDTCPLENDQRTGSTGFLGLIDYKAIERKPEARTSADPVCGVDEIKDPSQNRCLKLTCPLLQSPVYGRCVKVLSGTRYFGVSAVLVFTPVWVKANTAPKGYSFNFEKTAKNLNNVVRQKFDRCKPCEENVFASYGNKTSIAKANLFPEWFSILLIFSTTQRCQENQIVEKLNQLPGKEIELLFGTEYVTLTISAATKEEDGHYIGLDGKKDMIVISGTCPMKLATTDFQELSSCPSVPLNYTDYTNLMRSTKQMAKRRLIDALFKQTAMEGNDAGDTGNDATNTGNNATNTDNSGTTNKDNFKVQACFDTYLSLLPKKKNHGPSCGAIKLILFVAAMIATKLWN